MSAKLEKVIFLGTGTSSQVPLVPCLTQNPVSCQVCSSGRNPANQNRRRNTSLAIMFLDKDQKRRTVVIDCGKSFYESALRFFPEFGIREIDGVILTHGHADAILGLDDLRMWAMAGEDTPSIQVYLDTPTWRIVESVFPYLMDVNKSTGGGGVAALQFKEIVKELPPFSLHGLEFIPLKVMHGETYTCLGFRFADIVYLSDVVKIPEPAREKIQGASVIIIDALTVDCPHASHFTVKEAVAELKIFKPKKAYLIGFGHTIDHDEINRYLAEIEEVSIEASYDGLALTFPEQPNLTEK